MELTLIPAYGRDYKTVEALLTDWKDGKDFRISTSVYKYDGAYTSIHDLNQFPGKHVKLRYNGCRDFILIRVSDGGVVDDD